MRSKEHAPRYSHGLRITDVVALDSAQEAAGQLRFEIEAAFSQGLPNTPMANAIVRVVSSNFLTARPVGIVDGVDFIHSGVVRKASQRRACHSRVGHELHGQRDAQRQPHQVVERAEHGNEVGD